MFFKQLRIIPQAVKSARYWASKLGLQEHPEGGHFRETYRSQAQFKTERGLRSASTAIFYLLEKGQFSAFHRIKSDEMWHFYAGSPLAVHVIDEGGKLVTIKMGNDPGRKKQSLQAVVRAGCWFAAASTGQYSLVGCTVAPGFDFADWEVGRRADMLKEYPQHRRVIEKYAR
jgi:predicted cupin superfamily sugar epimerase